MPFVSVTRLRLRSPRFLPGFALHSLRSLRQIRAAPGFRGGALLADRAWAFWTMTAWSDGACMRAFMSSGAHRAAMPLLLEWCDEASVVHWDQAGEGLPTWAEAERRMRREGRPSRLRHAGPHHVDLSFRVARTAVVGPIRAPGAKHP